MLLLYHVKIKFLIFVVVDMMMIPASYYTVTLD